MRALLCGAGCVTRELLRRLGEGWRVSLIDTDPVRLERVGSLSPNLEATHEGDPSSPVILDRASAGSFDYVLALTDDDEVNLAICDHMSEYGKVQVCSLVHDSENLPKFEKLRVHTFSADFLMSKRLYNFLQDPRMHITPLTLGPASVFEVRAQEHFRVVGKNMSFFNDSDKKLVAVFRNNKLVFLEEDASIHPEDRLIVLGHPDVFESVCTLLECGHPHFPLAYGQSMVVALAYGEEEDHAPLLNEALFLAQNTQVRSITVLCGEDGCDIGDNVQQWPQDVEVSTEVSRDEVAENVRELDAKQSVGLLVAPVGHESFLASLVKQSIVSTAHELGCPVLAARRTFPYEKILVPFNNSPKAELALEVAVDLARQLDSEVHVAVVEVPEFFTGDEEGSWAESVRARIKELAHVHKMHFEEVIKKGNPVKEISSLSKDYDLIVMGSSNRQKGVLSPNVGEHMLRKAQCSVLVVTK